MVPQNHLDAMPVLLQAMKGFILLSFQNNGFLDASTDEGIRNVSNLLGNHRSSTTDDGATVDNNIVEPKKRSPEDLSHYYCEQT